MMRTLLTAPVAQTLLYFKRQLATNAVTGDWGYGKELVKGKRHGCSGKDCGALRAKPLQSQILHYMAQAIFHIQACQSALAHGQKNIGLTGPPCTCPGAH